MTHAVPAHLVPELRRAIAEEDLDAIIHAPVTRPHLYGGSRNNHMESCVQQVLEAYPHPGIAYLCRHHVVLAGEELSAAIRDVRRFLGTLHSESEACVARFNQHLFDCTAQEIRDEIDRLPHGLEQAIADFHCCDIEKDDHLALLRFVNAHAAILEDAQANDMAAIYTVFLYE
jgi:hypothetical protein